MAEPRAYRNFIDGEWVESKARKTFENGSPTDRGDVIGTFQDSDALDVGAATEAARRAYKRWRLVPAPKRAEYLFRMGEILVKRKDEYAREMTREMGKPLKEARGDVQEAIDVCYYIAGEGRRL
ncbi:MAG TPA: aldehyde dehydrogenase family protein, partial [Candidatus Polarisedimenticolia bacterium]|nr:aldehyde dehydrogenase family protein [Candidatus Polarisedimenticolia bacterium]